MKIEELERRPRTLVASKDADSAVQSAGLEA